MKTFILPLSITLVAGALAFTSGVHAQDTKTKTPQQQKFADCAHKSKGLKGEEHKKFMSTCLGRGARATNAEVSSGSASAAKDVSTKHPMSQQPNDKMMTSQQRMKACSTDAKSQQLKGDDRKAFIRDCMKNNSR